MKLIILFIIYTISFFANADDLINEYYTALRGNKALELNSVVEINGHKILILNPQYKTLIFDSNLRQGQA